MSLIPVIILENFSIQNQTGDGSTHQFKAGRVVEFHPTIIPDLEAGGYLSTDTSTTPTSRQLPNEFPEVAIDQSQLDTLTIDGTEHKQVHLFVNVDGAVTQPGNSTHWLPTAIADQIVSAGAGVIIRWPDTTDRGRTDRDETLTKLTVTS